MRRYTQLEMEQGFCKYKKPFATASKIMRIEGVEVFCSDNGCVKYGLDDGVRVWPYRYDNKLKCYTEVSGFYKPETIRRGLKSGMYIFK